MTDSSQPIAGWYPDPENTAAERWWDGTAWSDHRRPSTVTPPPPTTPVVPAGPPAPSAAAPHATPAVPAATGYPTPGYAPAYTPAAPSNSLAVVGLVVALAGLIVNLFGLTALAGAIISCVALSRAAKMRAAGNPAHRYGMALAGVIVGFAVFVIVVAASILVLVLLSDNSFGTSSFS